MTNASSFFVKFGSVNFYVVERFVGVSIGIAVMVVDDIFVAVVVGFIFFFFFFFNIICVIAVAAIVVNDIIVVFILFLFYEGIAFDILFIHFTNYRTHGHYGYFVLFYGFVIILII